MSRYCNNYNRCCPNNCYSNNRFYNNCGRNGFGNCGYGGFGNYGSRNCFCGLWPLLFLFCF